VLTHLVIFYFVLTPLFTFFSGAHTLSHLLLQCSHPSHLLFQCSHSYSPSTLVLSPLFTLFSGAHTPIQFFSCAHIPIHVLLVLTPLFHLLLWCSHSYSPPSLVHKSSKLYLRCSAFTIHGNKKDVPRMGLYLSTGVGISGKN
jgi:hypothetical protein